MDLILAKYSGVVARSVGRSSLFRRVLIVGVLIMAGCATMTKVTNLSDESCRTAFTNRLSAILTDQGETSEASDALASKAVFTLRTYDLGPRPFAIAAPSGTDYRFFVDRQGTECVLTLYGRRKGFVSYTNNLTYIATQPLPGCACADS